MSLALKQSHVSHSDLISVGSLVVINGRSATHRVKAISKDRQSAWISYGVDYSWWPMRELRYTSQQELF